MVRCLVGSTDSKYFTAALSVEVGFRRSTLTVFILGALAAGWQLVVE